MFILKPQNHFISKIIKAKPSLVLVLGIPFNQLLRMSIEICAVSMQELGIHINRGLANLFYNLAHALLELAFLFLVVSRNRVVLGHIHSLLSWKLELGRELVNGVESSCLVLASKRLSLRQLRRQEDISMTLEGAVIIL